MEAEHLIGFLPFVVEEHVLADGTLCRFDIVLSGDGLRILFRQSQSRLQLVIVQLVIL